MLDDRNLPDRRENRRIEHEFEWRGDVKRPSALPGPKTLQHSQSICVPSSRDQTSKENRWPAGSGVLRRPLLPLPGRPNPTDPGDAADLSIPQGYLSRVVDRPITIGND